MVEGKGRDWNFFACNFNKIYLCRYNISEIIPMIYDYKQQNFLFNYSMTTQTLYR